ncbi:MAG TPA: DUF952 domain-containing protein [Pyrinomonadaceae bacterium]|nr:DUF952 domain-containing protein [Pyrinomonadaceae bacterium]
MIIYHVVLPEVWEHYRTRPSYQAESLQTEGFIHCSYKDQLDGVLKRYYKNAGRILVLHIETDKLRSKLVEEPSTGGENYPHLYGRLNHNAVVKVEERLLS